MERSGVRTRIQQTLALPGFSAFWLGSAAQDLALGIWFLASSWIMLELTGSELWVGLLGLNAIPGAILTLLGGSVGDRVGRARLLAMTAVAYLLIVCVTAALASQALLLPWMLISLSLLIGGVWAFQHPTTNAIVADLVGRGKLVTANALSELAAYAGEIMTPLLAGSLLRAAGAPPTYAVAAVAASAATLLLWRVRRVTSATRRTVAAGAGLREVLDGLRYVARVRPLPALVLIASTALFGSMLAPLIPSVARSSLGLGAAGFVLLSAALGLGLATGSVALVLSKEISQKGWTILLAFATADGAIVLFGNATSPAGLLGSLFLVGAGSAVGGNLVLTLFQTYAAKAYRGRVMSVYSITAATVPLGAVLGGVSAALLGVPLTALISGLTAFLPVALAVVFTPELRLLPSGRR